MRSKLPRKPLKKIGTLGMIVDTKDEKGAGFYKKFGFKTLSASKNRLVLSYSAMKSLL
jgi:hypothetical protein